MADLWRIAWRYRFSAILLSLVLMPLFVVLVLLIPPEFASTAQILIRLTPPPTMAPPSDIAAGRPQQQYQAMQPNAAPVENGVPVETERWYAVSAGELIGSRAMAQRVVDHLGVERILQPQGRIAELLDSARRVAPADRLRALAARTHQTFWPAEDDIRVRWEEALASVSQMVEIQLAEDSNVLRLRGRTGDPFLSRDVVQAYLNEYQKMHAEAFAAPRPLNIAQTEAGAGDREAARQLDANTPSSHSEIWVVQPASLELKEVAPNRLMLLAVGMLMALLIGFGLAMGRAGLATTRSRMLARQYENWYSGDDGDPHSEAQPPEAARATSKLINLPR